MEGVFVLLRFVRKYRGHGISSIVQVHGRVINDFFFLSTKSSDFKHMAVFCTPNKHIYMRGT